MEIIYSQVTLSMILHIAVLLGAVLAMLAITRTILIWMHRRRMSTKSRDVWFQSERYLDRYVLVFAISTIISIVGLIGLSYIDVEKFVIETYSPSVVDLSPIRDELGAIRETLEKTESVVPVLPSPQADFPFGTAVLVLLIVFFAFRLYTLELKRGTREPGKWVKIPVIVAVLSLLIQFAQFGLKLFKEDDKVVAGESGEVAYKPLQTQIFKAGTVGPFHPASENPEDRTKQRHQICEVRKRLEEEGSPYALIVGRHDRRLLSAGAQKRVGSNSALAQARAETVAERLSSNQICAERPVENLVSLIGGPRILQLEDVTEGSANKLFSEDRSVDVFGFRASSSLPDKKSLEE